MMIMSSLFFLAGLAVAEEAAKDSPEAKVNAAEDAKLAANNAAKDAAEAKLAANNAAKDATEAKLAANDAANDATEAKLAANDAANDATDAKLAANNAANDATEAKLAAENVAKDAIAAKEKAERRAARLTGPPPGTRWSDTIEVDWTSGAPKADPLRLVYPVGTTLQVCVSHPVGTTMSVSATGVVGVEAATVFSPSTARVVGQGVSSVNSFARAHNNNGIDAEPAGLEPASAPSLAVACKTYAPFESGVVPVELKLTPVWTAQQKADAMHATQDAAEKDVAAKLAQQDAAAKVATFKKAIEDEEVKKAAYTAAEEKAKKAKGAEIATEKAAVIAAKTALDEATKAVTTAKNEAEEAVEKEDIAVRDAKRAALYVVESALEPQVLREETLALVIEPVNVGAVRVGVAAGWSRTADGQYEARVKPSSAEENADEAAADGEDATAASPEAVITQTGGGKESVEFVVSYTHFFTPVTDSYAGCHKGVMLGLGIADLQTAELGLSSVYLGFDLGWRLLSVSPSVTMRRVTMLAEGVELDSPVKSTQEIPLNEVWTPGFALVVHAPLDLMGAARSKGE